MKRMIGRPAQLLMLVAGFTIWGALFLALYGAQAIGCRLQWDRVELMAGLSLQRAALIVLFVAGLAAAALSWRWLAQLSHHRQSFAKPGAQFLGRLSAYASLAATGAVLFCFAAVFWLTPC